MTPKTGQTQRGPYERNLGVVTEKRKARFFGTNAQLATLADNAVKSVIRQWPLDPDEPAQATAKIPTVLAATTATLIGTVHDHGVSTVVTFEYGTTPLLGTSATADESPLSGDAWTAVSKDVVSLVASTQYYCRVKAVSSGITIYSPIITFVTPAA
ncbi:hypothetical protein KA005_47280 [bacterium]|nr:hypothetical protein [bacterium]